jgi:hypothetical protein
LVRDPSGAPLNRWSDSTLNQRLDVAHQRIAGITQCVLDTHYVDLYSTSAEYAMPSAFISEQEVCYLSDGVYKSLEKTSENELNRAGGWWRGTGGTPGMYYVRTGALGLYPAPTSDSPSGVRVRYYGIPDAFGADADIPFGGVGMYAPFHTVIAQEAARMCLLDDGKSDAGAMLYGLVQRGITEIRNQRNRELEATRMVTIYDALQTGSRRTA